MTTQSTQTGKAANTATPALDPRPSGQPVVHSATHVTMPAGAYYLGDPCYVFDNNERGTDEWTRLLENSDYFDAGESEGSPVGYVDVPADPSDPANSATVSLPVLAFGTAYGDGGYEDRDGNHYSVDAGMIGLVPAWWVAANMEANAGDLSYLTDNACFVVFDTDVECTKDGPDEGLLSFGRVEIVTHDEPEKCDDCGRETDHGYCTWGCTEEVCAFCGNPLDDCECDDDDDETDEDDD
jgi:hypothetical protein